MAVTSKGVSCLESFFVMQWHIQIHSGQYGVLYSVPLHS
jgi:hypothetical protein